MFKITARRQQQAICDLMHGKETIAYDQLHPDYQYLWRVVQDAGNEFKAWQDLTRVKSAEPDLTEAIDTILSMDSGGGKRYHSLADIGPDLPEVEWFWPHWIPKGMLTLLAAAPGVGKTNVALDLARRAIMGLPAPDKSRLQVYTGNVIYVDAENFLNVVYSRAVAWGMALKQFYPFQPEPGQMIDLASHDYQDDLKDMCYDLQPDLLIVDSLSSVNLKGENNIEDLREVLSFMVDLAEAFNLALVLIHHLRKPKQGQNTVTMHDLRGSGHLTAMARSILGVYVQSDDPNGPRRFKVLKTNLTRHPRPLSIHYVASNNPEIAMLSYDQEAIPDTPDNLTGACAEWLTAELQEAGSEGISYSDLVDMAAALEPPFSQNTIQRAREVLDWQVEDTKGPRVTGNRWRWHEETGEEIGHAHMLHVRQGGVKFYPPPPGHAACPHVRPDEELQRAYDRYQFALAGGE